MKNAVDTASSDIINISSFVKTGVGFQATLKFCLTNLTGSNVGINNGGGGDL